MPDILLFALTTREVIDASKSNKPSVILSVFNSEPKELQPDILCRTAEKYSHDVINRFLQKDKYSPALLWEHIKSEVLFSEAGQIIFDDTVLEKRHALKKL